MAITGSPGAREEIGVVLTLDDLLNSGMTRAEKMFNRTIKRMTLGATAMLAGITYGTYKAINASEEFNRSLASIATLIPGNTERTKQLKTEIQQLAMALGKSTDDLASGVYQVISAFGDAPDTIEKVKITAMAATAGAATTTQSLSLLSAVTKGYGDTSATALKKVSDLSFITVKLGQTTFPELAASIGKVVPFSEKLNVSQEELFANFATLTGVTGNTAEVSTQLRGVLGGLTKPTKEMSALTKQLGFSGSEAMVKELGLVGALGRLITNTDGSVESVGKLFESKEALSAVLALTGKQADTFNEKLKAMKKSGGATAEAFKEQTDGINKFEFEVNKFKVTFTVMLQKIGDFITQNPRFISAVGSATTALKEIGRILGVDVRTDLEKVNNEITMLERAEAKGVLSLKATTFAGKNYHKLLAQRAVLLKKAQTPQEELNKKTDKGTKNTKDLSDEIKKLNAIRKKAEASIGNVLQATEKIGASNEMLLALKVRDFALTGASIEQTQRYARALLAQASATETLNNKTSEGSFDQQVKDYEAYIKRMTSADQALSTLGSGPGVSMADGLGDFSALSDMFANKEALVTAHYERLNLIAQGSNATEATFMTEHFAHTNLMGEQSKQIRIATAMSMTSSLGSIMQSFNQFADGKNKAAFKAQKILATATALLGTYSGAAQVLGDPKLSFTAKLAAMAAVLAAGLAQVSAIKSQTMSGGSAPATNSDGTVVPSTPVSGRGTLPMTPAAGRSQAQTTHISVIINNPVGAEDATWDSLVRDKIIPSIETASRRGNQVLDINIGEA